MIRNNLVNFSWQQLTLCLEYYNEQYKELERVKNAVGVKELTINIDNSDLKNIFILRMLRDIRDIDRAVTLVNNEITRRNLLVGVI